jgi:hypothetical protein
VFGTTTLPDGTLNTPYAAGISASGGTGTITYAVTAGALPAGLVLATDGSFSGTPSEAGSFMFAVTATDGNSCGVPQDFTLFIDDTIFANGFDGQ